MVAVVAVMFEKLTLEACTLGGPVTVIVTLLLVAVDVVKQVMLLVIIQVTTSLLAKVSSTYVALLVPTLMPFFCH